MTEEHQENLKRAWDALYRRQLSNTDNLGRAILSLSTASLGVSVAFLSRSSSLTAETKVSLLHASWWAFAFAIVPILISYQTSQWGIAKQFTQSGKFPISIHTQVIHVNVNPDIIRKQVYTIR